jgi:hypothetical protein
LAQGVIPGFARFTRPSRRAWLALATATALLAYAAVLLWPFDWKPPEYVENKVEPLPEGGIRFAEPGIMRTYAPPEWVAAAMRTKELQVQLELRPLALEQTGPARIMTLSLDTSHRDLTIGQQGSDLILRLRTPASDLNGTVDDAPVARIPNVFRSTRWLTVGLRVEPGQLELSVDGRVAARQRLPADPFENWEPSYSFALGNELTYDRPWLGEIRRAVVRAGDTKVEYARSPELETPENFWLLRSTPRLIPFQQINPRDMIANVFLFIPLGVLFGTWLGRRAGRRAWRAIVLLAAISVSFETLQLFIPVRSPSIDDVIANTLGGALGVLLGRWRASSVDHHSPSFRQRLRPADQRSRG